MGLVRKPKTHDHEILEICGYTDATEEEDIEENMRDLSPLKDKVNGSPKREKDKKPKSPKKEKA